MNASDSSRAPASPPTLSASAPSGGYMTGAPEKYEENDGIAAPCSQCAHSRCPAHRYAASSMNAVSAPSKRTESSACTTSTASNGKPGRAPDPVNHPSPGAVFRACLVVPTDSPAPAAAGPGPALLLCGSPRKLRREQISACLAVIHRRTCLRSGATRGISRPPPAAHVHRAGPTHARTDTTSPGTAYERVVFRSRRMRHVCRFESPPS